MRYHQYPKRDPIKNYFPLPNELFVLGLSAGEIAIYAFLMRCENRDNYTCVLSYKEIGDAVNLSKNTVSKYVAMLEERLLIETDHTSVFTREGLKGNGKMRYKILPIQGAIDEWNRRGLARFEAAGKFNAKMATSRQNALPENAPSC